MPAPSQPVMRRFGDHAATRTAVFDGSLSAVQSLPPVQNSRYAMGFSDLGWSGSDTPSLADHKQALVEGRSITRRLTGTVSLTDRATNQVVDSRRMTIAAVPTMTNQGVFVHEGSPSVIASQMRLMPGIFTRRKGNGHVESHSNLLPGTGVPHRIGLDPASGVFKTAVSQAEIPTISLLKLLGATPQELREAWGEELYARNSKADRPHHIEKYWEKMGPPGVAPDGTDKAAVLAERISKYPLDPWVSARTLGKPYDKYGKEPLLAATAKLLRVSKGQEEPDDRDNPIFSTVWGPEHLIPERLSRSGPLLSKILWQATNTGNLKRIQPGFLSASIRNLFTKSGLALMPEGSNAAEFMDHGSRITKIGEGGIGRSADSVPFSARNVSSSQFPFIDAVRASESETIGLDLRVAFGTRLGADRKLYAPLRDTKSNKLVFRSIQDMADKTLGFPGVMHSKEDVVPVIRNGKITYAPKAEVDYVVPSMEQSFSPMTGMVPLKSASKPHRASMGARMLTQSLPLTNAESPLVRTQVPGQPGKSFEEMFGRHMGAVFANDKLGQVTAVDPDSITVKYGDGSAAKHERYNNHPSGRKTAIHTEPVVQVGDQVQPGQILARSNYTDNNGHAAYGKNLRVAFMNMKGKAYEDAIVLSESAAKKMTSDHLYRHQVGNDDDVMFGRAAHAAAFPGKHTLEKLKSFDDDGVIKVGTKVSHGDPLILAVRRKQGAFGRLSRSGKASLSDASDIWESEEEGEVTDVYRTKNGPVVLVKSTSSLKHGDKLCYDPGTEVLTDTGWKPVAEVTVLDRVASLNPDTDAIEYLHPAAVHIYDHVGRMYRLASTQYDLLVTENHKLYIDPRRNLDYKGTYRLVEAAAVAGKRFRMKRNGSWHGTSPAVVTLAGIGVPAGQGGRGYRDIPSIDVPVKTYAMLLGMYLSEGNLIHIPDSGTYGFEITQIKEPHQQHMHDELVAAGVKFTVVAGGDKVRIHSIHWYYHLLQFGRLSYEKRIPSTVFEWDTLELWTLYYWLTWGDGGVNLKTDRPRAYYTTSAGLAGDVQRLVLHLGMSANVTPRPAGEGYINGKLYQFRERYDVSVYSRKNTPEVNHSHSRKQKAFVERWEDYDGKVHCVTLPRNHVLYVRRNGKPIWCGNSGRHGNKGVAVVVPDHEMPVDGQGRPLEMVISSLGVISRANPSSIYESLLGKIAEKTKAPYVLNDWDDEGKNHDVGGFVRGELVKHGLQAKEELTDPMTGRKIPGVLTGLLYTMKLHHMSSSKVKGRGLGSYDESGQPVRGQNGGAMRASLGDTNALLSHGATDNIFDAHNFRGQDSPEFWMSFMSGYPATRPATSKPFDRFLTELKAAGIDPVKRDGRYHLMALTDKRVQEMAGGREVKNGETLDFSRNGEPVKGGLFDTQLWGTTDNGSTWAKVSLHEPVLNPAMEEPARKLLGLTEKQFRETIAGRHSIDGETGMAGIAKKLGTIDVSKELAKTRLQAQSSRKTAREEAFRRLFYLKGLERTGQSPKDWFLSAVPVIPPGYRPVSQGGPKNGIVVHDANIMYSELIGANHALKSLSKEVDDVGDERLNLYDAVKAVVGIGDPVGQKSREKGVKGVLGRLLGDTGKMSYLQQKLLGTPVNLSGRGQAVPNPDLDMDEIGIPESMAKDVYHPFVIRRLVRDGMPRVDAAREVENWGTRAKKALTDEMEHRPVLATRYPALHRYNVMAFHPKLVAGDALQINHMVVKGYNADFDGDAFTVNVPLSDEAVKEAREKLLPSRNLFSPANFKPTVSQPNMEVTQGLHAASTADDGNPHVEFKTRADAIAAYLTNPTKFGMGTRVRILDEG